MVTIKKSKNVFIFKDSDRNISYPINEEGLIALANGKTDELVIDDRGVRRVYNTETKLKGIEKELDVYEDSCGT